MRNRLLRLAVQLGPFAVLLAAPVAAQQPQAPRGVGFVRGVVYDSLLHAPLAGARVYINGTALSVLADEGGRFRLDSVPAGRHLLVFEHEDLDSAGLATNARRIEVTAGRVTVVDLATPSLATMYRAVCPRLPQSARDSGLVFGAVADARSGVRLARARVHLAWVRAGRGPDGRVQVSRPQLDATTDSLGNFYFCGVPTEYIVTVAATAGRFSSGVTELLLGRRGLARRDLAVSRDTLSLPDSSGRRRGTATLIGRVRDENDQPRPSARASVDEAPGEAFTDEDGRFVLRDLPAGSQMLMVRMIGYSATHVTVGLREHDTTVVGVRLHQLTVLDTMRVTASSLQGQIDLDELQQRRRIGLGYFISGEDVKRRQSMRAVVQGLPSMYIEGQTVFQFQPYTIVSGKPCATTIYVDGIRTDPEAIQSYRPDQLIGVEWFPRGSQAPLRYQPLENAECSVMLIGTRFIR
jgi:hypothetical protein